MVMASGVPETTMSTSEYSSCWKVGFTTQLPWMRPMRTEETRVLNGTLLTFSATDAPSMAMTSASFS